MPSHVSLVAEIGIDQPLAYPAGKGSAAILMSNLHAVLRTLAKAASSPAELCAQLNRHLHQVTKGLRFATIFYGDWNRAERRLRYVNAGHNIPILMGSCRGCQLEPSGPPLGLFLGTEYRVGEVTLQPGDTIVLYSDGVTEAGIEKGKEFGEARLEATIRAHGKKSLAEIQQQVLMALRNWAGEELEDDMTLLLVRATGSREGGV